MYTSKVSRKEMESRMEGSYSGLRKGKQKSSKRRRQFKVVLEK